MNDVSETIKSCFDGAIKSELEFHTLKRAEGLGFTKEFGEGFRAGLKQAQTLLPMVLTTVEESDGDFMWTPDPYESDFHDAEEN